jgi:hypothetical protein
VDEYVLSSTIPGDEAEALVDIEPFHGALGAPVAPTRFAQDSLQEEGVTCELVSGNPDFNVRKKENGRPKAKFDQYLDLV